MLHGTLIALHAAAGLTALVAGGIALRRGRFFDVYLWALVGTTVFLAAAVGVAWAATGAGARLLFGAFTALAAVMVWRAVLARRVRPAGTPTVAYVEHVGFTLVALFDAFVVVAVLDAGAPGWLVACAGVVVACAGHVAIRWARRTLTAQPSRSTPTAPLAPDAQQAPSRVQSTESKLPS